MKQGLRPQCLSKICALMYLLRTWSNKKKRFDRIAFLRPLFDCLYIKNIDNVAIAYSSLFSRKCPYRTHVLDAIATTEAGCSAPGFTQRKRSTIFMFWSYLICALASGTALRFYLHAGVSATTFWAHARWLSFCRKLLFLRAGCI